MPHVGDLKIKIFADGADFDGIIAMTKVPLGSGFTTNPTLMRRAAIAGYEGLSESFYASRSIVRFPSSRMLKKSFCEGFGV
jgi:transaldolase